MNPSQQNILRNLPPVQTLVDHPAVKPLIDELGREVVLQWVRVELDQARTRLLESDQTALDREAITEEITEAITQRAASAEQTRLGRVINATGVILHTGLGRAPLSKNAQAALTDLAESGNVEIDLQSNKRRYRGHQLLPAWQTLTGCEDSVVVNNNAAATLLTLQALCAGKEVVISRGQLIEIGGSFRLPEIFELSGAILKEVGTTNRTSITDYEKAIGPETAAIMCVHPSNYRVIGFTATPNIQELTQLAHARGLLSIDDIGSGSLIDVTRFGLPAEPTFQESIACEADVVLGSGDKLLGGPQAGIIIGKSACVERIRNYPLARAVRVGKLTLAALSATLDSYLRNSAEEEIPTVALLAATEEQLVNRAKAIQNEIGEQEKLTVVIETGMSPVGGGSLPGAELPTAVLALEHSHLSADEMTQKLRLAKIRIFGRIQNDKAILDLRSILPDDDSKVALAVRLLAAH